MVLSNIDLTKPIITALFLLLNLKICRLNLPVRANTEIRNTFLTKEVFPSLDWKKKTLQTKGGR